MNEAAVKKPVSVKKTILRVLLYFVVLDVCIPTLPCCVRR